VAPAEVATVLIFSTIDMMCGGGLVTVSIEIGGGEFGFPAAHSGLHAGEFEPLHGHTYQVLVQLHGEADPAAMLIDFREVKKALRLVLDRVRRRTLFPALAPGVEIRHERGQVHIACRRRCFAFPEDDVVLLPVVNTTTEALADLFLRQFLDALGPVAGLRAVELRLAESPETSASVSRQP
jgi:6-pyruvoyltetrahydropterin/6-carboxytetrahydropterin synthase